MVTDRRSAGFVPYEKAKADIKNYLTQEKQVKALDDLTQAAKKKSKIEYLDPKYNPDEIAKKLNKQVNHITNGQAEKVRNATKKDNKKK